MALSKYSLDTLELVYDVFRPSVDGLPPRKWPYYAQPFDRGWQRSVEISRLDDPTFRVLVWPENPHAVHGSPNADYVHMRALECDGPLRMDMPHVFMRDAELHAAVCHLFQVHCTWEDPKAARPQRRIPRSG